MTPVCWYASRAVPWSVLLGCCAGALLVAATAGLWPSSAGALLPAVLAWCAAAAAFLSDEAALPVVEVTPRGGTWRRTVRLSLATVPLVVWGLVVQFRPGDLELERGAWWLVGVATIGLAAGAGALASRGSVTTPGGPVAATVVLAVLAPALVGSSLGLASLYPVGEFPAEARAVWFGVAVAAVGCCWAALRPVFRR